MDISTGRRRLTAGSAAAVAGLAAVTVVGLPSPASAQPVCFGAASATKQFHLKIARALTHHRRAPALHVAPMR